MSVRALQRIARNVGDLAASVRFYEGALGFAALGPAVSDPELARLLRIEELRVQRLVLGGREIELSQCFPQGAAYDRADANFTHFQHIALLAPDIKAAWERALAHGAEAISDDGPVQLPPASGGVIAAKFRDPDGHPLEFLQNPAPGWDHSAISVASVERSIAFYAGIGVRLAARQRNIGPEQDALDGLDAADVDVVMLRPPQASPHVELLGYRSPKAIRCHWQVRDICADRLVFTADDGELRLLRDPDGHVIILDGRQRLIGLD